MRYAAEFAVSHLPFLFAQDVLRCKLSENIKFINFLEPFVPFTTVRHHVINFMFNACLSYASNEESYGADKIIIAAIST